MIRGWISALAVLLAACGQPETERKKAQPDPEPPELDCHVFGALGPGEVSGTGHAGFQIDVLEGSLEGQTVVARISATAPCYLDCSSFPDFTVVERRDLPAAETVSIDFDAEPGRRYRVNLDAGCRRVNSNEWVAPEAPLDDPSVLVGKTWASPGTTFELDYETWTHVLSELEQVLHMVWLPVVRADALDGNALTLVLGWPDVSDASAPSQKVCTASQTVTATFTNPGFRTAPADMRVITGAGSARVYEAVFEADVSDSADQLVNVRFSGRFDLRDLAEEFGGSVADLCDAMPQALDRSCEACPDGEESCVFLSARNVVAEHWEALVVEERVDPCGIDDSIARWDYELSQILSSDTDLVGVRGRDFDGQILWETPLASAPTTLQISEVGPEHWLYARDEVSGVYWVLERDGGAILEGPLSMDGYPEPPRTGDLVPVPGGFGVGGQTGARRWAYGLSGIACSTAAIGLGTVPLSAVLIPMLLAVRRRRP